MFGALISGPAAPEFGASLVVEFSAELARPDGTRVLIDDARVDFPVADEAPGEGPSFSCAAHAQATCLPAL